MAKNNSIPKIIHYCWFGNNELPESAKKCILSWRSFFPDYEIKEWNENNFDLNCCEYVKAAYSENKWAHVSDYVRFWVVYKYGGIYFDTDVEVIRDFSSILENGPFMGNENYDLSVNPGLCLGAYAGHPIYLEILNHYESSSFYDEFGNLDLFNTVVLRTTEVLKKYGLINKGDFQKVLDISIYPREYFSPYDFETGNIDITDNSYSIHWFDASWFPTDDKYIHDIELKIHQKLKGSFLSKVCCVVFRKMYRLKQLLLKKSGGK